jgi:hypothetical protein
VQASPSSSVQARPRFAAEPSSELPPRIGLVVAALDEAGRLFQQMKEDAVSRADFEWAAALRDQHDNLRKLRAWLVQHRDHDRPRFER